MYVKINNGNSITKISYNIQSDNLIISSINFNNISITLYDLSNHRKFIEDYINNFDIKNKKEIVWKYDSNTTIVIKNNSIVYEKSDNNDILHITITNDNTYNSQVSYLRKKILDIFKDILLYWDNKQEFLYKYSNKIECSDNDDINNKGIPF